MRYATNLILLLYSFLTFSSLFAQKTKAVVTFKEGIVMEGFAKLLGESLKFKLDKKSKSKPYHLALIENVQLYEHSTPSVYVYTMLSNKQDAKVVKRFEVGKVSLFYLSKKGYRSHGISGQNSGYVSATNNTYVKRGLKAVATHIGSNKLVSKNFKKAAT